MTQHYDTRRHINWSMLLFIGVDFGLLMFTLTTCSMALTDANLGSAIDKAVEAHAPRQLKSAKDSLPDIPNGQMIAMAEDAVRNRAFDPKAAQFQNEIVKEGPNAQSPPLVCGQVNEKNKYGGYTGFQSFISNGVQEATFLSSDGPRKFRAAWKKLCLEGATR